MENKMRTILKNFDKADKVYQIIFADEYECTLEGGWCYLKINDSKKKEEQRLFLNMSYDKKKLYSIEHANRYVEYCKEMSWEEFEKEWNWCDKFGKEIATGIGCCIAQYLTDYLYNPRYWEWDTFKEFKPVEEYKTIKSCKECAKEHRQLAEWLKELKQLREQTKWISVSERLPEKYTYTLWCASSGYVRSDYFNGEFWEDAKKLGYEVIAWMPLPKPYEPQERSDKE